MVKHFNTQFDILVHKDKNAPWQRETKHTKRTIKLVIAK